MKKTFAILGLLSIGISSTITLAACTPSIIKTESKLSKDIAPTINETSDIAKLLILSRTNSLANLPTSSLLKYKNKTFNVDFALSNIHKHNNNIPSGAMGNGSINNLLINWTNIDKNLGKKSKNELMDQNSIINQVGLASNVANLILNQNFKIQQAKELVNLLKTIRPKINQSIGTDVQRIVDKIDNVIENYGIKGIDIINKDWANIIITFREQIIELFKNGTIPVSDVLSLIDTLYGNNSNLMIDPNDKDKEIGRWFEEKSKLLVPKFMNLINGQSIDFDELLKDALLVIKMQAYWMEQIKINSQDLKIQDIKNRYHIYDKNKTNEEFFYEILNTKTKNHIKNFNNYKFADLLGTIKYYEFLDENDVEQFSIQRLVGSFIGYGYSKPERFWQKGTTYYLPLAHIMRELAYSYINSEWIWAIAKGTIDSTIAGLMNGDNKIGVDLSQWNSKWPNLLVSKEVLYDSIRLQKIGEPIKTHLNNGLNALWNKYGSYAIEYIKELKIQQVMDWLAIDWISVPYLYDLKDKTIGNVYDIVTKWFEIKGYQFDLKNVWVLVRALLTDTYTLKQNDKSITSNTMSTLVYVVTQDLAKQKDITLVHKSGNKVVEYTNAKNFLNNIIGINGNEFIDNSIGLMITRIYGNKADGSYDENATLTVHKVFEGIEEIIKWTQTKSMKRFNDDYINSLIDNKYWTTKFASEKNYYDIKKDAYIKYWLSYEEFKDSKTTFEITIRRKATIFNSWKANDWSIDNIELIN